MRTITINGKRYNAKPFDFNTVCSLEESGVSVSEMGKKPMSMARAYLALCMDSTNEDAGKEIQAHVISGGNIQEIYTVMADEMNDSDFFQALKQEESEDSQTVEEKVDKKAK